MGILIVPYAIILEDEDSISCETCYGRGEFADMCL
jgi:hypothetical protein